MYLHLSCQYLYFLRAATSHNLIDACTNRFVRSLKKGRFVLLRAVIYPIGKGQPANHKQIARPSATWSKSYLLLLPLRQKLRRQLPHPPQSTQEV